MAGTLSSFNTALSALRYNSVALQNASNNIANNASEGYVRRRAVGAEVVGTDRPTMYAHSTSHGEGVRVAGIQRQVDPLLDARVRREHASQAYLDTKSAVLARVETGIGEPGENGVSAALAEFKQSWSDLANHPEVPAPRQQVLARASILADSLAAQSRNISGEEADQRVKLNGIVEEVNTAASDLAELNQKILVTGLNGIDNNALRDTRDQLALRLSELTGAATTVRPDGMFDLSVNGVSLVDGTDANPLTVTAGVLADGSADGSPIAFALGGTAVPTTGLQGELGATTDLLENALPDHREALNVIARQFADAVNAQHALGFDAAGTAGGQFFSYVAGDEAASLAVAITDPAAVAASGLPGGNNDGGNADKMSVVGTAAVDYQRLVNGFGTDVAAVQRKAANQAAMTAQVDNSWESQAGVNLDEETVNMVTSQRAYEAASKLMTVLDDMLDTLINRTGLTR